MSKVEVEAGDLAFRLQQTRPCCRHEHESSMSGSASLRESKSTAKELLQRWLSCALALLASALLLISLKLPLWRMHLEAPQYRDKEALNIAVHPDRLQGDLRELTVLEQYIGVHVPPTLPQFKWLPALLTGGAGLGFLAGFLQGTFRKLALMVLSCALIAGLALAAFQAMTQISDIGHKRDSKTVLVGIKDFTPPFLGTSKIAQFTVSSRFGAGAWLIGAALLLQLGAAGLSSPSSLRKVSLRQSTTNEDLVSNPDSSR